MPMADFSTPIAGRARLGDAQMQRIVRLLRAAAGRPPCSPARGSTSRRCRCRRNRSRSAGGHGPWRSPPAPAAVTPPYFASSSFSSEPPLTPMRMGMPRSRQASATARTRSFEPMLPGLMRILSMPRSHAHQRQLVVEVDVRHQRDVDARLDGRPTASRRLHRPAPPPG